MTTLNTIIEEEEKQLYCEHCKGCGEVGCDGIETFLNKHVRGKTDCLYEDSYIDDIIEMYKEDTTALQRAYEAGQSEERARIREIFDDWFVNGTQDVEDWADRNLPTNQGQISR